MLSNEDNALLTRVGKGSDLGALLREYWHPVLLSSELPEPDCDQLRIKVLGEELIAFRDSAGRVGVLDERCAHRRASLFFGRNEEGGIRCPYHGWKYDVDGRCLDMPNEPPPATIKEKIRQKAYRVREVAGTIWVYMGDKEVPPPLPNLEWLGLAPDQLYHSKRVQQCNWLQALEGDIDQSHVGFTHRRLDTNGRLTGQESVDRIRSQDLHPKMAAFDMPYGVLIGAGRKAGEGEEYWRVSQFLFPHWVMTGPYGENPTRHMRAWVPIDDTSVMMFTVTFHPLQPLSPEIVAKMKAGTGAGYVGQDNFREPTTAPFGAWYPKASLENDFLMDRKLQKTSYYSGIREFWAQDAALQESMGVITNRNEEHLLQSDIGIVRVRRRLLQALRDYRTSLAAPAVTEPDAFAVRGAAALIPAGASWVDATAGHRKVLPGVNQAGV
jgi:phthalate 4,5-dioxygenase oxygenase subunit